MDVQEETYCVTIFSEIVDEIVWLSSDCVSVAGISSCQCLTIYVVAKQPRIFQTVHLTGLTSTQASAASIKLLDFMH